MAALIRNHIYRRGLEKYVTFNSSTRKMCMLSKISANNSKECLSKICLTTSQRIVLFAKADTRPLLRLLCVRFQSSGESFETTSNSASSVSRLVDTRTEIIDGTIPVSSERPDAFSNASTFGNNISHDSLYTSELQTSETSVVDFIPEPPVPIVSQPIIDISEFSSVITDRLEPTLASQGLGAWTPVGLVQHVLDWLHISGGLPWWGAIALATLIARMLLFPIFIKGQKNAVILTNNLPQMQFLQLKISEARQSGNHIDAMKYSHELSLFMKEKNCNPMKAFMVPLAQAPVFISFFIGLRKMANLPIESFKEGGIFWFTDLTMTDPYFLLPVITCVTLFITIETGAESGIRANQMQAVRYLMRALPVIMFPFIINFPAAILCYWVTTNGITLSQVILLKIPAVKRFLKFPPKIDHNPSDLPIKKKGFVDTIRDTLNNSKITREMEDRARIDAMKFRKAGMGPVPKTYAYNPTKQRKD